MNKIEKSIIDYQNHFKAFIIDSELKEYINSYYYDKNIHEKLNNLIVLINDAKSNNKNYLLENLENLLRNMKIYLIFKKS